MSSRDGIGVGSTTAVSSTSSTASTGSTGSPGPITLALALGKSISTLLPELSAAGFCGLGERGGSTMVEAGGGPSVCSGLRRGLSGAAASAPSTGGWVGCVEEEGIGSDDIALWISRIEIVSVCVNESRTRRDGETRHSVSIGFLGCVPMHPSVSFAHIRNLVPTGGVVDSPRGSPFRKEGRGATECVDDWSV